MNRPNFLTNRHLSLLENLKLPQLTDMFYSVPYILQNCPELNARQAQEAIIFWLNETTPQYNPEFLEALN